MTVREHLVDSPAGRLRWLETSGREGAVALVHGNSSSPEHWRPVLESPLGARYRMCALELPGHGESHREDASAYTVNGLREALVTWLEVAGLGGAAVVGHSLGGHLVLELGRERLERQAGVFVHGTPPLGVPLDFAQLFHEHPALGFLSAGEVSDDEALVFVEACVAPAAVEPTVVLATIRDTDVRFRPTFMASAGAGELIDEVAVVRELRRPVALVHGGDERLVRLDYLEQLEVAHLWRDRVHVIEHAGHYPQLAEREQFVALLGEFLADVL